MTHFLRRKQFFPNTSSFRLSVPLYEYLSRLHIGQTRPEGLKEEGLGLDGRPPIGEGHTAVLVHVHLAQGHLDQVLQSRSHDIAIRIMKLGLIYLDSFVLVLIQSLPPQRRLEHVQHLLSGDESIAVQVVDVKAVRDLFLFGALI